MVQVTHKQLQLVTERNEEETLSLYTFDTCVVHKIEKHLKTHHTFSVHTTPVEYKTTTIRVTNSHVDSVTPYPL